MTRLLSPVLLSPVLLVLAALPAEAAERPPVVVELFTSQGCSSCPPADRLLQELSTQRDLVTLSFHVDYWDYIGWRDPFAQPGFTARQKTYAAALGARNIYTPQIVVDGGAHEVGSDRSRVVARIEAARRAAKLGVTMEPSGGALQIHVDAGPPPSAPTGIYLALFDRSHETPVRRGENSGATLTNTHVVRQFTRLADWSGPAVDLSLPPEGFKAGDGGAAILVQPDKGGRILGAALLFRPDLPH
jgi:hypothetical protein